MISKVGTERQSVQEPVLQYAREIGWEYINPDEIEKSRDGRSGLLLKEIFTQQMLKLNPTFINKSMIEDLIKKIQKLPVNIEGNLEMWKYLKGLKTVYVPQEKRERNVKLIDEDPHKNVYHVSDEFSFSNGRFTNRYDIVFFINGIPLILVETKSSHKLEGMEKAFEQVKRYHYETPEAMTVFQIYVLTHLIQFYYSSTWNFSSKALFSWKSETKLYDSESLIKSFFDKKRILLTILNFILFTRKDDELQKFVLRPHQMRAIQKVAERAKEGHKKRGLVWHTQGSGKTYTMIVSAKSIIENPMFENPTVIMLVDRNELESQLFANLHSVGFEHVKIASSKNDLRRMLRDDTRGLIVSMIHKFEGMPPNINTKNNIFILIDEAHRTTGGDLGTYLMSALPNATIIGFTGTPIDKTNHGKGTFVIFGKDDPPHGYLDKYGIAESIEDGTTVKLHYALASYELLPDKETLEQEFLNLTDTEGVSDIETINRILDKAVRLKTILKSKERIKKITEYIVNHYKNNVEPLGYKAFIVAVDREACILYKQELDKHLPEEYSEVVFSSAQNDPIFFKDFYLSEKKEKEIRKNFIKPDQNPKILIVTEKLLTGYDAPILYCMYLDKPMRDHVLLQAIARVNRPYEDQKGIKKPCGIIIDFIGTFETLEKALSFDSRDISHVVSDIQVLKENFKKKMDIAKKEYLYIIERKKKDKEQEAIFTHFMDEEKRKEFYKFYRELSDMYEVLSPDEFLRDYLDDYHTLTNMVSILKEAYDSHFLIKHELTYKTAELIKKHISISNIKPQLEVYEIDETTIQKIENSNKSDIEKIFSLFKSIEKEIIENVKENPYLLSIKERVEALISSFKQRQMEVQETLESLKEEIEKINRFHRERKEKNMNNDVYTVYWILKDHHIEQAEAIAKEIEDILNTYPHWKISEEQERELKKKLFKSIHDKISNKKMDTIIIVGEPNIDNYKKITHIVNEIITKLKVNNDIHQ